MSRKGISRRGLIGNVALMTGGMMVRHLIHAPFGSAAAAQPKKGGILKAAMTGEPPSLDAHWTTTDLTYNVSAPYGETLFTLGHRYSAIPLLAEGITVQNQGRVQLIRLRKGVPFHTGQEMTSRDVVASLRRWARKASAGPIVFGRGAKINAKDTYTVEVTFEEPSGRVDAFTAFPNQHPVIYPESVIEAAGDGQVKQYVGTGPFKFVEHVPDRYTRFQRFDKYAARPEPPDGLGGHREAYLDELRLMPVPDAAVRVSGVESGDFDFADPVSPDQYDRLRANPQLVSYFVKPDAYLSPVFNKKEGLFADLRMRQAFYTALNCETVLEATYGPKAFWKMTPSLNGEETIWGTDSGKDLYNPNNPAKAKQLLQSAGYDGRPIRWMTTKTYEWMYKASLACKSQVEAVGFKVDLSVYDWATVVSRFSNPAIWDVWVTSFNSVADPARKIYFDGRFSGWWDTPRKNALFEKFVTEADRGKRFQYWTVLQKMVFEELPVAPIGQYFDLRVGQKRMQNYQNFYVPFYWNVWLA